MTSYWKRSMAMLLGTGVIALTAACGAEVGGTAATDGGIPAVASAAPASTPPGAGGSEPSFEPPSVAEPSPTTEPEPPSPSAPVAAPTTSPSPTSEGGGTPAAPQAAPASTPPAPPPAATEPPSTKSTAGSAGDYAFTKDYCTLMPKSAVTGLEKDATRDKTSTCTYRTPDSSKDLKIVTVSGGFDLSYQELDESYNVDLAKVKIDGRDGFTWTTSSKSLYSALFNLPKEDGGAMSILVIITDDGLSPAELKAKALELAAEVSKNVPR